MNGRLQLLRLEVRSDVAAFTARDTVPLDPGRLVGLRQKALEVRTTLLADFERVDLWFAALADRT